MRIERIPSGKLELARQTAAQALWWRIRKLLDRCSVDREQGKSTVWRGNHNIGARTIRMASGTIQRSTGKYNKGRASKCGNHLNGMASMAKYAISWVWRQAYVVGNHARRQIFDAHFSSRMPDGVWRTKSCGGVRTRKSTSYSRSLISRLTWQRYTASTTWCPE